MTFQPAIPVFRIFDYEQAMAFYRDWLGFTVDWEHQYTPDYPRYLQVSRAGTLLHLTEHHGDCTPGSKAVIHIDDADALHQEITVTRRHPRMNPSVQTMPWNAKVVEVMDPFGNKLWFHQSLES
ncbi:glyoxalase superfamily protein [Roseimicrobium sp. ORNL1]|uniref:glyoxalase superfamily protein n=1 Tax=Roseimicrobium sp. ORNL1 TaxID=2711231 RepID=UPI0013E102CC|nr:glyoxalase superfamily protein [Roseimicrobium sp. ORNL1]QIF00193.1 VOC family protein [Roseimicrobium sp. ORNL1]